MSGENQSLRKRIDALETRLANQERAQRAQSERAIGFTWPRERWLARTTSDSPGSYPTSGDTFQAELLTGYFTATEGTRTVTEQLRGTKPIARTWPATYLPRGTEVIAERIRGHGPSGSGEWWIQPTGAAGAVELLEYGGYTALNGGDLATRNYTLNSQPYLWFFPDAPANDYFDRAAPAQHGAAWLTCREPGRYLFIVATRWLLYVIPDATYSENQLDIYVAPNLQSYPVFGRYGDPTASVSSQLSVNGDPAGLGAGDAYGISRAPIRPTTGVEPWQRVTHVGATAQTLAAGDVVRLAGRAQVEWPGAWYAPRPTPQIEHEDCTVQVLYCGPA